MAIILALALLVSVGTSYSAESSLPGDTLYPIKTGVNENVRGWFAVSEEAEARLASNLALKRIEEAEELLAQGEFNSDVRARIEVNFEEQAERMGERLRKLEEENEIEAAADISSNFETSLEAHEKILLRFKEKDDDSDEDIDLVLVKLRLHSDSARDDREDFEIKISAGADVQAAAEGKLKAAENKISEVKKYIISKKESLGVEATLKAEARIKAAEDKVAEGKIKIEAKEYGDAFEKFQQSIRIAQEAKLLVEARSELKIEVDLNGSDDDDMDGDEDNDDGNISTSIESTINSDFGTVKLKYSSGILELFARLNRANPCIDWRAETQASADSPASNITFSITKHSRAEFCIQVLGEPQDIEVKVPNVGSNANITVKVEGKIIHSSRLR